MTDDQKRKQRGELMVDLEDAQAHAAALCVALKGESDKLSAVAEWVHEASRSINVHDLGDEFFSRTMSRRVNIAKDQQFRETLNIDHIISLRNEAIAAQKRVEELAARLRQLKSVA